MSTPKGKYPKVHTSPSGRRYVDTKELLNSEAAQQEIRRNARAQEIPTMTTHSTTTPSPTASERAERAADAIC